MIILCLFSCAILLCGCTNQAPPPQKGEMISKIIIKGYGSQTVLCPALTIDKIKESAIPVYNITDTYMIKKITNELSQLKEISNKHDVFVKCILYLYKNDTLEHSVYLGDDVLYDNKGLCFNNSKNLWALVDNSIGSLKRDSVEIIISDVSNKKYNVSLFCEYLKTKIPDKLLMYSSSLSFIIRCRISKLGKCIDAKMSKKDPVTLAIIPNELILLIETICLDFEWGPDNERNENEWIYIPVSIRNDTMPEEDSVRADLQS